MWAVTVKGSQYNIRIDGRPGHVALAHIDILVNGALVNTVRSSTSLKSRKLVWCYRFPVGDREAVLKCREFYMAQGFSLFIDGELVEASPGAKIIPAERINRDALIASGFALGFAFCTVVWSQGTVTTEALVSFGLVVLLLLPLVLYALGYIGKKVWIALVILAVSLLSILAWIQA